MVSPFRLRAALLTLIGLLLAAASHAGEGLSPGIEEVIGASKFKHAHWGILVVDLATGETIYSHQPDKLFAPASTTKLYSVASALEHLGSDYRFRTPIYRRGDVVDGRLRGDLILVASGDLTLGGRTDENGQIAFTNTDHTYANGSSSAELTPQDPLAGLDQLARQVAEAGIKQVTGEVLIDARLFDTATSSGSGPSQVTPMLVNDNLIDLTITPSQEGSLASIDWRPRASFFEVENKVQTTSGTTTHIHILQSEGGNFVVAGHIPAGKNPLVRVFEVPDSSNWARSLLIDALRRADIEVAASPSESNDADKLPAIADYQHLERVAEFESPPFSENARLILKVSHNLHASTLPLLVAAQQGKRRLADGLRLQHDFLKRAGVDVDAISFGGAAGGATADFTTPRANVELLRHMSTRPDFDVYLQSLPVLGVDGTLHDVVAADSPARGQVQAKTGTLYWHNAMNDRYLLVSKALAGYMTAKSGRRLAISFVVGGVHLSMPDERNEIGKTMGRLAELVHDAQ